MQNDLLNSQFYLNIIERIPYYIFWKDSNFCYLGCNQKFADLIGKQFPREIIGKTDFELGWEEGRAEFFRDSDQRIMNGMPKINVEEVLIQPDGSRMVLLVNKLPLRDENGNCIGILGASVNISERKKLEEDLNAEKEYAEKMNKVKTEFLINMRHDVKPPLADIADSAQLLLKKEKDAKTRESLEKIMKCSRTLMYFFDNCLELSTLENADITLMNKRLEVTELIHGLTTFCEEDVFKKESAAPARKTEHAVS